MSAQSQISTNMKEVHQQRLDHQAQVKAILNAPAPVTNCQHLKSYKQGLILRLKKEVRAIKYIRTKGFDGHLEAMESIAKAKMLIQCIDDAENFTYTTIHGKHLVRDARFASELNVLVDQIRRAHNDGDTRKCRELLQQIKQYKVSDKINQMIGDNAQLELILQALPKQPYVRDTSWNNLILALGNIETVNTYNHCHNKPLAMTCLSLGRHIEEEIEVFDRLLGRGGAENIEERQAVAQAANLANLKKWVPKDRKGKEDQKPFFAMRDFGNLVVPTATVTTLTRTDKLDQVEMEHPLIGVSNDMEKLLDAHKQQPYYRGQKPAFQKFCCLVVQKLKKGDRILPTQMIERVEFPRNAYLKQVFVSPLANAGTERRLEPVLEDVHTGAIATYAEQKYKEGDENLDKYRHSYEASRKQIHLLAEAHTEITATAAATNHFTTSLVTPLPVEYHLAKVVKKMRPESAAARQTMHGTRRLNLMQIAESSASDSDDVASHASTRQAGQIMRSAVIPINAARHLAQSKRELLADLPSYYKDLRHYLLDVGYHLPEPLWRALDYRFDAPNYQKIQSTTHASPLTSKNRRVLFDIFDKHPGFEEKYPEAFKLLALSQKIPGQTKLIGGKPLFHASDVMALESEQRQELLKLIFDPAQLNKGLRELSEMDREYKCKGRTPIDAIIKELVELQCYMAHLPTEAKTALKTLNQCQSLTADFYYDIHATKKRSVELASLLPNLAYEFSQIRPGKGCEASKVKWMNYFACKSGKDRAGNVNQYSTWHALWKANQRYGAEHSRSAVIAHMTGWAAEKNAGGLGATQGCVSFTGSKDCAPQIFSEFNAANFQPNATMHKNPPKPVELGKLSLALGKIKRKLMPAKQAEIVRVNGKMFESKKSKAQKIIDWRQKKTIEFNPFNLFGDSRRHAASTSVRPGRSK